MGLQIIQITGDFNWLKFFVVVVKLSKQLSKICQFKKNLFFFVYMKSKIGKIFTNEKMLEENSVKVNEIDSHFYEHYKKKYKLIEMDATTYYLELMFIFVNMIQLQKLMKRTMLGESSFLEKKTGSTRKNTWL